MECASNIDAKNALDKPQNNGTHHDNRDIGEYKEENASNHKSRDYTEVPKLASIVLVSLKLSLQSG